MKYLKCIINRNIYITCNKNNSFFFFYLFIIVFFGTCCGYKINHTQYHYPDLTFEENHKSYCDNTEQEDIQTEKICSSLKDAITFARDNHLIGILCEATPLVNL